MLDAYNRWTVVLPLQYRSQCSSCHGLIDDSSFVGLRQTDQLAADPLDEAKSVAVVAHIVNNRGIAAHLFDVVEDHRLGAAC